MGELPHVRKQPACVEIPSRISVFLLNVSLFSEPLRSTLPSTTSVVAKPASPEPQSLPSVEVGLDRNSAKSPGSAVLCRAEPRVWPVWCESREVGSSSKLRQTFYRRRTEVWGMDLSEVGAEIGSCGDRWEGKHTKEMQNHPEVRSLSMDRAREGGYCAEVGGRVIPKTLSDLL